MCGKGEEMMRTRDWYEKNNKQMTEYVRDKVIVSCSVSYSILALNFSDGSSLRIIYDNLLDWGLLEPASS